MVERAGPTPGPIPNPVVTQRSAGEYYRGDPWEARAIWRESPHPQSEGKLSAAHYNGARVAGEQRQLVGLITQRSGVRMA